MEAERNQKIEITKLEESRNLAQEEMEKLQSSLKDSSEELGQAKKRMDSVIAEKEAALNQIDSMKEHFEVRLYLKDGPRFCDRYLFITGADHSVE